MRTVLHAFLVNSFSKKINSRLLLNSQSSEFLSVL